MIIELKDHEITTECILLAKYKLGYQNLLLISSHIQTNTNPFLLADLSPLSNGLFCIGESTNENEELLIKLQAVFSERFYLKIDTSRSEEHTSELQSRGHLVCRLLLEKKKKKNK